jgi:hypothetical protein
MKTTERIKELSTKKYGRILADVDKDFVEFLNLCCQNAASMADLLERAEHLVDAGHSEVAKTKQCSFVSRTKC